MKDVTLYVGGDDSNHAGKTRGEIIVGTFSVLDGENVVSNFGRKRDFKKALDYVSEIGRDWRFTVRAGDQYRHYSQNVPRILPTLINHFLYDFYNNPKFSDYKIIKVCAFADGEVKEREQKIFGETVFGLPFSDDLKSVSISGYTKKKINCGTHFSKGYECPSLVWVADSIANGLFRNCLVKDLFKHEKMILPIIDR